MSRRQRLHGEISDWRASWRVKCEDRGKDDYNRRAEGRYWVGILEFLFCTILILFSLVFFSMNFKFDCAIPSLEPSYITISDSRFLHPSVQGKRACSLFP